jgi:TPP-dependent pyruvate/acetoin dehydrogenase alpha subunit
VATDVAASPEAALDIDGDTAARPQAERHVPSPRLTDADRSALLSAMLMMRGLEARALSLYKQGKVPGSFYDGFGQEAVSAGAAFALAPEDRLCILHRDLAAHLIRGAEPSRILAQYMGRAAGYTRGRDGNVHFGDAARGCLGMVSMLPDMMVVATGMAMAFKLRGERRVALTFCGDGASSRGDFHEALNWAAVQDLGVIFIVENNGYAYSTPTSAQFRVDPVDRAAAYGMPGVAVDGNDAEAVFDAVMDARERAVDGGGPTLIEARTMRMHGHAAHDDMRYVPGDLVSHWRERDPIALERDRVLRAGGDVAAIEAAVTAAVEAATREALASPMPDPAEVLDGVFCEGDPIALGDGLAPWSGLTRA